MDPYGLDCVSAEHPIIAQLIRVSVISSLVLRAPPFLLHLLVDPNIKMSG